MNRFNSLMLLSICISFVMCSASFADIPSEQRGKLDRMLSEVRVEGSIHDEKNQSDAVKAAAGYIINRIGFLGLPQQDYGIWVSALRNISTGSSPLEVVRWEADPQTEIQEETVESFKKRQARYTVQVSLVAAFTHYLKGKFPVAPEGGGSCPMDVDGATPSGAFKRLVPLVAEVTDKMHVEKEAHSGKAPHFTAQQLFTDISLLDHFDGLDVHMEGVKVLRGNLEQGYRSGPGGELMVAVGNPVLGSTPMSSVNAEPVRLTSSKASQMFFKGLPAEMMATNGVWEGYRVDLDRSEFIYTGIYKDPKSRALVPFFFMKKVEAGEPASALNADLESGKLEKAAREKSIQNDMMQAALQLGQGSEWDFPITEAVHNYLVLYPDLGKAVGANERNELEISRLSREHARKVEEYSIKKKAKNAELRSRLFPPGWRESVTRNEVWARESQLNAEVSNILAPLGRDLDSLEEKLTELRTEQIKQRLPVGSAAEQARFLMTDIADRGVPLAQYKLAEMWKNGVGGPADDAKRQHYAQLAANQGLPEVKSGPSRESTQFFAHDRLHDTRRRNPNTNASRWPMPMDSPPPPFGFFPSGMGPPPEPAAAPAIRPAGAPTLVTEGSEDYRRVPAAFAAIGPMHRIGDYILSANGPEFESEGQADGYCRSKGGVLPYKEWDLVEAWWRGQPPQTFNPDLVPDFRGKTFWSKSGESTYRFNGTTGKPFLPLPRDGVVPTTVRCIIKPVGISRVLGPDRIYVNDEAITRAVAPALVTEGSEDYGRVRAEFAALGPMHRIGNYILSADGPVFPSVTAANDYCRSIRSQLPSWNVWDVMRNEIETYSPRGIYDPDLVVGLRGKTLWTKNNKVSGTTGLRIHEGDAGYSEPTRARCVVSYRTPSTIRRQEPPSRSPLNPLTEGSPEYIMVNPNWPAVERLYRLGDYIFGSVGSGLEVNTPTPAEAIRYCRGLGAQVPTEGDWGLIKQSILRYRPGQERWDPDLVPEMRDKRFWLSNGHKINGTTGESDETGNLPIHVWCIKLVR